MIKGLVLLWEELSVLGMAAGPCLCCHPCLGALSQMLWTCCGCCRSAKSSRDAFCGLSFVIGHADPSSDARGVAEPARLCKAPFTCEKEEYLHFEEPGVCSACFQNKEISEVQADAMKCNLFYFFC